MDSISFLSCKVQLIVIPRRVATGAMDFATDCGNCWANGLISGLQLHQQVAQKGAALVSLLAQRQGRRIHGCNTTCYHTMTQSDADLITLPTLPYLDPI